MARCRHSSTLLQVYVRPKNVFVSGKGCMLTDGEGKKFLDFTAGIAVNALGHNEKNINDIIGKQSAKLIHLSNLYHNEYAEELSNKMVASLGKNTSALSNAQVFFSNSGTEANEAAFKFARKYARTVYPTEDKIGFLSFKNGFHGRTLGALSATPNEKYQKPFLPLVPGFQALKFNCMADIDKIDRKICAIIIEPIQGEGGINVADLEYIQALRKKCDEVGALLIFDEIQCGVGRTGKMYGYQNYKVEPDIITMAKPLANGLPLGAVLMGGHVADTIKPGDHGTTFGGSPLTTRVGVYVWDTISKPDFLDHVIKMGDYIRLKGEELVKLSPLVKEVRGKGLLMGLELRESVPTSLFVDLCRERGVLVVSAGSNTIRLIPKLNICKNAIDKAFAVFESVITTMEGILASGKL